MRTTVNVDEKLLAEAERIAGEKSASVVINTALEEFVQARLIKDLLALRGKIHLALGWEEMERLEMAEFDKAQK